MNTMQSSDIIWYGQVSAPHFKLIFNSIVLKSNGYKIFYLGTTAFIDWMKVTKKNQIKTVFG